MCVSGGGTPLYFLVKQIRFSLFNQQVTLLQIFVESGVRTHAVERLLDLKSNPLDHLGHPNVCVCFFLRALDEVRTRDLRVPFNNLRAKNKAKQKKRRRT